MDSAKLDRAYQMLHREVGSGINDDTEAFQSVIDVSGHIGELNDRIAELEALIAKIEGYNRQHQRDLMLKDARIEKLVDRDYFYAVANRQKARIAKLEPALQEIRDAIFLPGFDINYTADNLRGYVARLQMRAAAALNSGDE